MSRRIKIGMTLVSLLLSIVTLSYGVYAAVQSKFKMTSEVSFTSVEVLVEVTEIKVYQADLENGFVTKQAEPLVDKTSGFYDQEFDPTGENTDLSSVDLGSLTFNDTAASKVREFLVFEIYFKNYSENTVNAALNPKNSTTNASTLPNSVDFVSNTGASVSTVSTTLDAGAVGTPLATTKPSSTANSANQALVVIIHLTSLNNALVDSSMKINIVFTKG